jgi:hypothetical protein
VNETNAQIGANDLEVLVDEGPAVVGIELSGKTSAPEGLFETAQESLSISGFCVGSIGDKAGMIINEEAEVSGYGFGMQSQEGIGVLGIGIFTAATLLMAEGIRSQASVTRAAIQDLQNRWKSAQDNLQKEFALNAFAESPILTKESTNPTLTSALPILLEASQDADRHVSLRAIGLLHDIQYGDRRSVLELGRWVRCGTNLSAANLAAKALKEMRSAAIPAIPDLIKSLENRRDDGSLIHGGRGADGSVTEDDSGETIGDPRLGTALRRATIEALGNLGPAAIDAVPVLRGLLSDRRHFSLGSRVFSAKALWQITGQTNATLPVLVEALRDENSFLAADILGSMGSEATLAIPALVDAIERGHSDTQIRARFALRRITTPSSH